MAPHTFTLVFNILLVFSSLFAIYGIYYMFIALFGFKNRPETYSSEPSTRFAILIAARNEATVIGQLVDSLKAQNYPDDKYDIIVAPNNCTDNTREIALEHGAQVFDPVGKISSKGEVLTQIINKLMAEDNYDAVCVFDADNLVHPNFLQQMNNAKNSGIKVAQGFRDSKNPSDSAVSTCYSVCYWMLNRFYNGGREALGLSGLVNGSGFMVDISLLRRIGGWHTCTMTEDYEFSAQCVIEGEKVHYVQDAIIYDEQPLTFHQSWKQRRRWSTGSVQGMEIYLWPLLKKGFAGRSGAAMDMAVTFMMPVIQLLSTILGVISLMFSAYGIFHFRMIPLPDVLWMAGSAVVAAFLICAALAAFTIMINLGGENAKGTAKGIAYFSLFLLSWLPIGIISIFKKTKTWDPIAHTSTISVADVRTGTD